MESTRKAMTIENLVDISVGLIISFLSPNFIVSMYKMFIRYNFQFLMIEKGPKKSISQTIYWQFINI